MLWGQLVVFKFNFTKSYASELISYPRRIALRTRLLPLWAGRWICLQMFPRSAIRCKTCKIDTQTRWAGLTEPSEYPKEEKHIKANTSSGKSLGWGDVNLILTLGSIRDTWSSRSEKRRPPPLCLVDCLKATAELGCIWTTDLLVWRVPVAVHILTQQRHLLHTLTEAPSTHSSGTLKCSF